ncbi:hypothetical protein [Thalassoroseus pseudoceratinae]|uniref:hypothetical protein n=1 Tax=Thalassoroseus pseudoceratinae TaxID=2713176 RepID=UPI00142356C8|nr:hypothetical protein [Thalassoroseus pseudoceratinae]
MSTPWTTFTAIALLAVSQMLGVADVMACPFCGGPQLTLKERAIESDAIGFATFLRTESTSASDTNDHALFKVDQVLLGMRYVKSGAIIRVDTRESLAKGQTYLLFGAKRTRLSWGDPIPATKAVCDYLQDAPGVREPTPIRLKYYVQFLEHADETIAVDAFSEFGNARYDDIAAIATDLPKERLRGWLSDEGNLLNRRGVYGMMLGLCGDTSDEERLAAIIRHSPMKDQIRVGIDGIMGGYLLLTGDAGLSKLEDWKLKDRNEPFTETYGALQAVRFMWTYGKGRISKPRLRQSVRLLLERPELADMVIADLARWRDWSVQERIVKLMDDPRYDNKIFHRAVARYLLVASTVPAEMQHKPPKHAVAAKIAVDRLRAEQPDLMRQVERFYRPRVHDQGATP